MSPKKSYWHTIPGILTAIAGVVTALTGLVVALQQTGIVGRDQKRVLTDETQEMRVLVAQVQDMREQIAIERRRLEALNEKLGRQPGEAETRNLWVSRSESASSTRPRVRRSRRSAGFSSIHRWATQTRSGSRA